MLGVKTTQAISLCRSPLLGKSPFSIHIQTILVQTRLASEVEPKTKPRKTYKVMRKVNPAEQVLSPEQWKHMRVRTLLIRTLVRVICT